MAAFAHCLRLALLLPALLIGGQAAWAQATTPMGICEDEKSLPPDRRAACTTVIDSAASSRPDKAEAYFYRGEAAFDSNDFDAAIADFSEAIKLNADNSAAFILRGNSYDAKGDADKALADYSEAIRLDPNDATGYFNRAEVHASKGNKPAALTDYEKALSIEPGHEGAKAGLEELKK